MLVVEEEEVLVDQGPMVLMEIMGGMVVLEFNSCNFPLCQVQIITMPQEVEEVHILQVDLEARALAMEGAALVATLRGPVVEDSIMLVHPLRIQEAVEEEERVMVLAAKLVPLELLVSSFSDIMALNVALVEACQR
jgi:hypothetical protein